MISRRRGRFLVLLVCVWFYGTLLLLYPKSFRLRYSAELRRDFFGLSREALREGGILGVVRVWAHAFSALALTAIRRRRTTLPMERRVASAMVMMLQVAVIAVVVAMVSFWQTPTYEASAQVRVDQRIGNQENDEGLQSLMPTLIDAIDSRSVAEEALRNETIRPFEMSSEELLNNLTIEQVEGTNFIRLTYEDEGPLQAKYVASTVADAASGRISATKWAPGRNLTANVYRRAIVSDNPTPVSPNPFRNGLLTLVVGLTLCLILKRREFKYALTNRGAVRDATYYLWGRGYAYYLSLGPTISAKATTAVGLFVAVALSVASMVGGGGSKPAPFD